MHTLLRILGNIPRGFNLRGSKQERGSFKCWPPRSMTAEEIEYYTKHKNLNSN